MKERDLAQLSDKLERLQNSRGSHAVSVIFPEVHSKPLEKKSMQYIHS